MKVKKLENLYHKSGLKGCIWSRMNAPGTPTPLSHPILKLGEFPFPIISPLGLWGNKNWPSSMKVKKLENLHPKSGLKGCKWSRMNGPGTKNPLPHPFLKFRYSPSLFFEERFHEIWIHIAFAYDACVYVVIWMKERIKIALWNSCLFFFFRRILARAKLLFIGCENFVPPLFTTLAWNNLHYSRNRLQPGSGNSAKPKVFFSTMR